MIPSTTSPTFHNETKTMHAVVSWMARVRLPLDLSVEEEWLHITRRHVFNCWCYFRVENAQACGESRSCYLFVWHVALFNSVQYIYSQWNNLKREMYYSRLYSPYTFMYRTLLMSTRTIPPNEWQITLYTDLYTTCSSELGWELGAALCDALGSVLGEALGVELGADLESHPTNSGGGRHPLCTVEVGRVIVCLPYYCQPTIR
jgi:hypothetical protein